MPPFGRGTAPATRTPATLAPTTSSRLHSTGFSRSRVASYCSACSRVRRADEALDASSRPGRTGAALSRPADRRRADRRSRRRAARPRTSSVLRSRQTALSRSSQCVASHAPREQQRRPPRVGGEHDRGRQAADHLDQAAGDEVHRDRQRRAGHPEVEVARDGEIAGQLRDLRGGPCRAAARTPRSAGRRATPRCGRRGWR